MLGTPNLTQIHEQERHDGIHRERALLESMRAQADLVIDTRAAAIDALAKYGAAEALPTLKAALQDKDWAVRIKAAELLKTLDPGVDTRDAIRPAPLRRQVDYASPSLTNPAFSPHVYIETEKGSIEIELDVLDAPITAHNFMTLARRGYFDGLSFHRVVPNFVVQGGVPGANELDSMRDEVGLWPHVRGAVGISMENHRQIEAAQGADV